VIARLVHCFLFCIISVASITAQTHDAQFPGGREQMSKFIRENLQYPEKAAAFYGDTSFKVFVNVSATGETAYDFTVAENDLLGFVESIVNMVNKMPNWQPAMYEGERHSTQVMITVNFQNIPAGQKVAPKRVASSRRSNIKYRDYYIHYEEPPQYLKGDVALRLHMRNYMLEMHAVQSTNSSVYIRMIVNPEGHLSGVVVLDKEGEIPAEHWVAAFYRSGKWKPAKVNGRYVKAEYRMRLYLNY